MVGGARGSASSSGSSARTWSVGPGGVPAARPAYTCYGRARLLGVIIAAGSGFECFTGIISLS